MNWELPKVFAVQHKDEVIRATSRSGGIFTALSNWVFENDGIVYGCVLDEHFLAVHAKATNLEEQKPMRGSKYIQSKLGETYKSIKKDVNSGRLVLFSGTSCQVAGLKKYLGKTFTNLLCVDIVCHGVPSPKVWKEYLEWQEKKKKSKIKFVSFRNKEKFGWRAHIESLLFENGYVENSKIFANLFMEHSVLRPCCYECPYKSVIHPADITIADYWGIEKAAPEFDDDKGVSLVLINNEKGDRFFSSVKSTVRWKETKIEDSMQPSLIRSSSRPDRRERFWNDFKNKNFNYIAIKYGGAGLRNRVKYNIRRLKRRLVG